jgi:hypothetical protein
MNINSLFKRVKVTILICVLYHTRQGIGKKINFHRRENYFFGLFWDKMVFFIHKENPRWCFYGTRSE